MIGLGYLKELAEQRRETPEDKEQVRTETNKTESALAKDEKAKLHALYGTFLTQLPLEKNTILYESFGGRGMICSPFALFKYLLSQKKYEKYEHVWVIDDFEDNRLQMERYRGLGNVRFVQYRSEEYVKALATAGYLINNVSFPGFFVKRKGQTYLNTWHGVPMKTMGFDIPGGNVSSGNSARNLLSADYLISAGPYMTEKAYLESYKLKGIYEGTILENGFPRNDVFFDSDRAEILRNLRENGVDVAPDKKIILYAPTWKGEKYSRPETGLDDYFRLIEVIEQNVDTSKYQVLVKPHQIVYYYVKNSLREAGKFIPATVDTNELLSVTEVLISDYSSIHFDFLVSGRPMVFFLPDLDDFAASRGLYFGLDKLPGPVIRSYEELGECFRKVEALAGADAEKYREERSWACPGDDGNVCRRTIEAFLGGKKSGNAVKCNATDKKKLLVYGGVLGDCDHTENFLSVLNNMDCEKYDITLLAEAESEAGNQIIDGIRPEVRVLYWKPFYAASPEELARHHLTERKKEDSTLYPPKDFYRRELLRAAGDAKFDAVFAFSEESSVFNHMTELMKGVKRVNWGSVKNRKMPVNLAKIREEEACQRILEIDGKQEYLVSVKEEDEGVFEVETVELPDKNTTNFVTWGHMTKENHYEKLLQAFENLLRNGEAAHLYFLGEGPLRAKLEKLALEKGLENSVSFLGRPEYPLGFIALCDCFVLESGAGSRNPWVLAAKALGIRSLSSYRELGTALKEGEKPSFDAVSWNREAWNELEADFH